MSVHLNSKCRTCLSDSNINYKLSDCVDENYKILDMLDGIVPQIDIKIPSKFSTLICQSCVDKLLTGYKFQQLCIETNNCLNELFDTASVEVQPVQRSHPLSDETSFKMKQEIDNLYFESEFLPEEHSGEITSVGVNTILPDSSCKSDNNSSFHQTSEHDKRGNNSLTTENISKPHFHPANEKAAIVQSNELLCQPQKCLGVQKGKTKVDQSAIDLLKIARLKMLETDNMPFNKKAIRSTKIVPTIIVKEEIEVCDSIDDYDDSVCSSNEYKDLEDNSEPELYKNCNFLKTTHSIDKMENDGVKQRKTKTQYQNEYRKRLRSKKDSEESLSDDVPRIKVEIQTPAKTGAKRQRECRGRFKVRKCVETQQKTESQRQRESRQQQKFKKCSDKARAATEESHSDNVESENLKKRSGNRKYKSELKLQIQNKKLDDLPRKEKEKVLYTDNSPRVTNIIEVGKTMLANNDQQLDVRSLDQARTNFNYSACEYSAVCATPKVILHHENVRGDGNCFFYSVITILKLNCTAAELRRELLHSIHLPQCPDPNNARLILSTDYEWADMDCIYIFSREYNQNVCVHLHYFNDITATEEMCFSHFIVNPTENFIHLHLTDEHFTPYLLTQKQIVIEELENQLYEQSSALEFNNFGTDKKVAVLYKEIDVMTTPINTNYYKQDPLKNFK